MAESERIKLLKSILRREVALLCEHNERRWKKPISTTIDEIKERQWPAVFFGGTPRSLLLSRLSEKGPGRPRDIDIVVREASLTDLHQQFRSYISRQTRFGGFHLCREDWQFDVWPLEETFGIKGFQSRLTDFSDLPKSTFFNLEAIAVDVWPKTGQARTIYSDDDQFFRGVLSQTIEVNRAENPFPELCVVRAIVMAANLQWKVGPNLARYLAEYGGRMSEADFKSVQKKHYGRVRFGGELFVKVKKHILDLVGRSRGDSIELPIPKQLTLWPEPQGWPHLRLRTLGSATELDTFRGSAYHDFVP